ncbi:hypothetical protein [Nostoc sp. FACHB-190]|nr:hypothetical protein [Nostoc sp. FACHB-190]MBD2301205.1 hypothetical protein [Nostoc sp. FACHB-190]
MYLQSLTLSIAYSHFPINFTDQWYDRTFSLLCSNIMISDRTLTDE